MVSMAGLLGFTKTAKNSSGWGRGGQEIHTLFIVFFTSLSCWESPRENTSDYGLRSPRGRSVQGEDANLPLVLNGTTGTWTGI